MLQSGLFSSGSGSHWVVRSLDWTETGSDSEATCGFCGRSTFFSVGQLKGQFVQNENNTHLLPTTLKTVFNLSTVYRRHLSHKWLPSFQTFCLGFFPDLHEKLIIFLKTFRAVCQVSFCSDVQEKKKSYKCLSWKNNCDFRSSCFMCLYLHIYAHLHTHTKVQTEVVTLRSLAKTGFFFLLSLLLCLNVVLQQLQLLWTQKSWQWDELTLDTVPGGHVRRA